MTKFSIDYNPYLVETTFLKNGKELGPSSTFSSKKNERFQVLLGKTSNWDGLCEEIARTCDDDEVEITFRGRIIDFEDLKSTVALYEGDTKFTLNYIETRNDADIISQLDEVFAEIQKKDLPHFKQKNADGKDIFEAYRDVKNGIFEVSVIATMSSGKSTLINSLLHTELLPSENKACTATIARILDNDEMDGYMAECFDSDRKVLVPRSELTLDKMREYNSNEQVTYIDIEGSIPAIPSDRIRLCLRDTPGPNNSRNENHGRLTNSIIRSTNAIVLYVMNATQFGINDDKELLLNISQEMKRSGKQSRDRFIFVINKCDMLDEEKGETIDKLLADVREYLKGFGIVDPILVPTSAQLALLIRKNLGGEKLTRQERNTLNQVDDFVDTPKLHFEKYATLNPSIAEVLEAKVEEYHKDEEKWDYEALIHTGIPAVEAIVREYIEKYAYPMKIHDAIKDIISILDTLDMHSKFEQSISVDSDKLDKVRAQIESAKKKNSGSKAIYDAFKAKINGFSLNSLSLDDTLFDIEQKLAALSKPYDGKTAVDKTDADIMISEFLEALEAFQKDCESTLNREIDEQFYSKCVEMLDEYTRNVRGILDDIDIEGYDFKKHDSFKKITIANINEIQKRNEQDRYKKETRWKDNPERAGFFGFFKFWKPKKVSYTVDVKDGVDVNVKNTIVDIMTPFSKSIKENITDIFKQAYSQIDEYKTAFMLNIDTLEAEINKILAELEKNTRDSEELKKRVEENRELMLWVEQQETAIRSLLNF